jgi:branched-chain amino acid transport system substrate-binding protein
MNTTKPIKIGYSMSLTRPLGANGQTALLAHRIWEEDVNRRRGLLGRPVQLISASTTGRTPRRTESDKL